jgi:YfiH family protein
MLEPYSADCLTVLPGISHGFFTRQGGTSRGIYQSLNCGAGSNDDRVSVLQNRARVAHHLGSPHGDVVTLYQVHSATALVVNSPVSREDLPKADALVTKTRGLAIGVLTADCTPVLFADAKAGVVGAAHAGWRGALGGIVEATVAAMEGLGARHSNIRAAVGPCISQRAYEVGPEFEAEFLAKDLAFARFFARKSRDSKPYFNLAAFINERLQALNLAVVEISAPCTYENESLFFSFRRSQHKKQPDYGRQISAIVVT